LATLATCARWSGPGPVTLANFARWPALALAQPILQTLHSGQPILQTLQDGQPRMLPSQSCEVCNMAPATLAHVARWPGPALTRPWPSQSCKLCKMTPAHPILQTLQDGPGPGPANLAHFARWPRPWPIQSCTLCTMASPLPWASQSSKRCKMFYVLAQPIVHT
jgi:hypothetical protein